jgi:phosphoglycerate dehydrogenase-like enzyme
LITAGGYCKLIHSNQLSQRRANPLTTPRVLIIAEDADDYAAQIDMDSAGSIPAVACTTAEKATKAYDGQSIILGQPDMIAAVIAEMPQVKWVQSTWAGVNPLLALDRRDYLLTGVKGIFGPIMSEYVVAYLLAHELKVLQRAEQQQQHKWFNETSGSLNSKRAGIMGTGSIGAHIAGVLRSFGVHVTGLSRSGAQVQSFEQVYPASRIKTFLGELDYLVSVLPDTKQTNELLNSETLAYLPNHAYLINIGRANVLEDTALIKALNDEQLAGAVLDVFRQEPLPPESPLWSTPRLLITAHIAADSQVPDITPIFTSNYAKFTKQLELEYVIDFDRAY